jgi:hypothetical protein
VTHAHHSDEASARVATALERYDDAVDTIARAMNSAPCLTLEHFAGASEVALELIITDDAHFAFPVRVLAARTYTDRLLRHLGPPEKPMKGGMRRLIPQGVLEDLSCGVPDRQASALAAVRGHLIRWTRELREGRDPLTGDQLTKRFPL